MGLTNDEIRSQLRRLEALSEVLNRESKMLQSALDEDEDAFIEIRRRQTDRSVAISAAKHDDIDINANQ